MMKKAVAILLAAVLLLSLITTTFAATPIISFGKATFTTIGETKTLVIEGRDLDSVSVIQFTVKYDSSKVKLLNVAPDNSTKNFSGEVIDAAKNGIIKDATVNGKTAGEVVVVWESTEGIKEDGILVELQFEALVANAGEIKLELDRTQDFLVCKDNSNGVPSVNVQVETTNEPLPPKGFKVSGTATSFLDANGTVTIKLFKTDETEASYETTVVGNSGTYSFESVAPGTYTMEVSKTNHVTREYEIVVSDSEITQDIKIHPIGDINGDGTVTNSDVTKSLRHIKKTALLSGYEFDCADINGDGSITNSDNTKALRHVKKVVTLW